MLSLGASSITALPPPVHYAAYSLAKNQGETPASRMLASAVRATARGSGAGTARRGGEDLGPALRRAAEARRNPSERSIDLLV